MKRLDIREFAGRDIISRAAAHDIRLFIDNTAPDIVELDFSGVAFTTRSFMDEFFNSVYKALGDKVKISGMSPDLAAMLKAVSRTQGRRGVVVSPKPFIQAKSVEDLERAFDSISV